MARRPLLSGSILFLAIAIAIAAPAAAQTCVEPADGLVGWWPGDGSPEDVHGGNTGALHGATFAEGMVDRAFRFDGLDDYVEVPDAPGLALDRQWFAAFWARPSAYPDDGLLAVLVNKWVSGGEDKGIFLDSLGRIQARLSGVPAERPLSTSGLPLGEWSHVAVVYDGTALDIYIDGVLDGSAGLADDVLDAGGGLFFGRHPQREGEDKVPFAGSLDEVEWAAAAPEPGDIEALFQAGSAGRCRPLTCGDVLAQALADLDACLDTPDTPDTPAMQDADGDGEHDRTDACPDTPPDTEVDGDGCSQEQFCGNMTNRACRLSDWRNDEPLGNPRDCRAEPSRRRGWWHRGNRGRDGDEGDRRRPREVDCRPY